MYGKFEELLKERKITVTELCKATGIPNSTISDWKSGRYTPKLDKIQKIADYFNVSVEYLTGSDDVKYSDEKAELLAKLLNNEELMDAINIYYSLPDHTKKLVISLIKELGKDR